jgi:2,3-dihydroxybenzoate-AMP ligase
LSSSATSRGLSAPDVVPYPEELARQYRSSGLWNGRTIAHELMATAAAYPDHAAVVATDQVLTFSMLDQNSDRLAHGLRGLGLQPGERVLLQLTNSAWTVLAWYGLLKAGLVPVATLALHRRHELAEIARQCEPAAHLIEPRYPSHDLTSLAAEIAAAQPSIRILLTVGAGPSPASGTAIESLLARKVSPVAARQEVERVQQGISPDSVAVLQLSGGTTSVPKLIPRLHSEYWYNSRAWAAAVGMKAGDCALHLMPIVHNAGIVCAVHAAHSAGAAVALCSPDPAQLAEVTQRAQVTHMLMTRAIVDAIHRAPGHARLASLRAITWADRTLPPEVVDEFETGSAVVGQMFGMGEGMCLGTPFDAPPQIRHHTQGTRISDLDEIRVLEPGTEQPVQAGERGELCARGPYTIRGYFRAPERNAQAFTSDGFYRTGDIVVEVRHQGRSYYRLEDRIKDLINRGGEKINAQEIEELLISHPAIDRAAVVAMPDDRLGDRACAFVVALPGATPPDLAGIRAFLEERGVAKFKWPERIEVREQLPLTSTHKVNKVLLREEIRQTLSELRGQRLTEEP